MTIQPKTFSETPHELKTAKAASGTAVNLKTFMRLDWRQTLVALVREYACIATCFVLAISLIGAVSSILVEGALYLVFILVNGALIHRLALLGHEGSHGCLAKSQTINDVIAEWLCFFPIFGSLSRYREVHRRHHQYVNIAHQDPNLDYGKHLWWERHFTSTQRRSYFALHALLLWPPFIVKQAWDLLRKGSLRAQQDPKLDRGIPVAARLGIGYVVILVALVHTDLVWALIWSLSSLVVCLLLPNNWFPMTASMAYAPRWTAIMRVAYLAVLLLSLGLATKISGIDFFHWYFMLWLMPLLFVFPYLMFLREAYQHGGAGVSRYDNSRNMQLDPIRTWAILAYGNNLHQTHHLLPSVAHYWLPELDRALNESDPEYKKMVQKVSSDGLSLQAAMYPYLSNVSKKSDL